jgi:integrase
MHIRPNSIRGLKTKTSVRTVPLSERCQNLANSMLEGLSSTCPIFERYGRPRGSDAASGMLMKHLRLVVEDSKVTIHSIRHRMKDRLRNTGCPEAISRELLGHAQPGIAANYGSGYALEVMREHILVILSTYGISVPKIPELPTPRITKIFLKILDQILRWKRGKFALFWVNLNHCFFTKK